VSAWATWVVLYGRSGGAIIYKLDTSWHAIKGWLISPKEPFVEPTAFCIQQKIKAPRLSPPPAAGAAAAAWCLLGTPLGVEVVLLIFMIMGLHSREWCLQTSESGWHWVVEGLEVDVPPTNLSGVTHAHPLCLVWGGGNLNCEGGPPGWCKCY
jgi:hypothetical protein